MTRVVSFALLLVAALGAGSELAWATEAHEVRVETSGTELPPTQEVEDVEVSDEVVFDASSTGELTTPPTIVAGERSFDSVSDVPLTRPPRG